MSTPTAQPSTAELEATGGWLCQRSGPGKGCEPLRWSQCRACGWHGELWDGDQPPLLDAGHVCEPAAVERRNPR
ncbi:hypothetical protein V6U90_16135 [Micromonospora sp. CPCC 206060]|uniref:hypothetical protein n=1 Tax=Micromonospora sp. CPCC 206060 TaxID=3122406 RepID=UPI002FEEBAF6